MRANCSFDMHLILLKENVIFTFFTYELFGEKFIFNEV